MSACSELEAEPAIAQESWDCFCRVVSDAQALCLKLQGDFVASWEHTTESDFQETNSRALVRCFGSLLDGLTTGMRQIAVATCKLFHRPLNPFLQDKVEERSTNTYQRIFTTYRLIGEFLPGSPLAAIHDRLWHDLHSALEIRNRIMHPKSVCDLELIRAQTLLVMRTGKEFHEHFNKFNVWAMEKQQKLIMPYMVSYRRMMPKLQRNEPCRCGSNRKFKNCCFKATAIAA